MNKLIKFIGMMIELYFKNYVFYFAIISLKNGRVDTHTNMSKDTELYFLEEALKRKK